ncbi:hypothetical protein MAL1_00124 [Bacteriophage DSS3_MAL1]|nr:hypothetical protein MAL1_00124 [Bacteriophage DSS3_MAL1]
MAFTKFPSLESFGHVWRNKSSMMGGPVQKYRAKIKLHGTNAAIRVEDGIVYAQKRTSDITPDQDNAGFANWLEPRKEVWAGVECADPVTFFGEWAGPGVQKGDAVSLISRKMFFIFAVQLGDEMITCPDLISELMPEDCPELDDVMVLPWTDNVYTIDFSDPIKADEIAAELTKIAEDIGTLDPFIANTFGVEGPGEGVVMVPVPTYGKTTPRDVYSAFTFKVKAARHGAKKAKAASRKVEIPAGAKEFVEMFVTEARCQQGLVEACDGVPEKPRTADFLKWMGADVKKESEVELLEAGLEWKQVAKLVNAAAVKWFHEKCSRPFSEAA